MEATQAAIVKKHPSLGAAEKRKILQAQISRNILAAFERGERNEARLKSSGLVAWGLQRVDAWSVE
jgi:hypothetical protein